MTSIQRYLLLTIYGALDMDEAMLAGIDQIQNGIAPFVPLGGSRGLESVFLERRSYDSSGSFVLVPRDARNVRMKLFQMILNDPGRRNAAFATLGQVEVWRIEHGRPNVEPRHPMIESGVSWPPVAALG